MASYSSIQKSARGGSPKTDPERWREPPPRSSSRIDTRVEGGAPIDFAPQQRRDHTSELARMIESEIIPRLMLAHRARPAGADVAAVGPRTLESFVRMTLAREADTLVAFVESLMNGGLALEDVYVQLLIPTAHRLGDDWNEDVISFTDVTIGLTRLQQVVRTLGWRVAPPQDGDSAPRAAYFMPCPREQHTFGLVLLEDCFRRDGWRTSLDSTATDEGASATVREEWFDVFGLGATSDTPIAQITAVIARVRRASLNRGLFVLVGGRPFIDRPELAAEVGADATAPTAPAALLIANEAVRAVAFG